MMILPNDLKKYRNKKILKIIVPFVILFSISIAACFLLNREIPSLQNATEIKTKAVYIVLLAFPFVVTRFPKKLIDKSWCGEIVDVEPKAYTSISYRRSCVYTYTKVSIVLKVKLNDTKVVEVVAFETPEITDSLTSLHSTIRRIPSGGTEQELSKYIIGDKVFHYYLFDNLLVVSNKKQTITCIVCGTVNPKNNHRCAICGHSILN